jgi:hypothetical protein
MKPQEQFVRMLSPFLALALCLAVVHPAAGQATSTVRVRGEIVAVTADSLTVRGRDGNPVVLLLKPDTPVLTVKNVPFSSIKQGVFIGTATRSAPDGSLVALEVVVFPEAARGTGEGHYGWDLLPGSSMTNANVDSVVEGVQGSALTLSYKGGSQKVTVPSGVPVVTVIPASRGDLLVGKKVFAVVSAGENDAPTAARVIVEKDGVAPPM